MPPLTAADRLAGCLLGQALGDALGFVVEARPPDVAQAYVRDWLLAGRAGERAHPDFPFGQYTDDTQLARELLISVRDGGRLEPCGVRGPNRRAVPRSARTSGPVKARDGAARRLLAGTSWQESGTPAPYAGNGSAMRAAPLGLSLRR